MFPSIREALHATATGARQPMKVLAADLDYSPSELSMRTTLGGDSARTFPLDDEHAVRIQQITGDHSVLYTMCDKLGYDPPRAKDRDVTKMVAEARASVTEAVKKFQQLALELDKGGKR